MTRSAKLADAPRGRLKLGRNFHKLWGASAISALGDGMYLTALPLLAIQLTDDPLHLGFVGAAGELPWLVLALSAGALIDRWDRRRVMWRIDAMRFVLMAGLCVAVLTSHASIPLLIVVAFALGCGQVFFDLSAQALIPDAVPRDQQSLTLANSRMNAAQTNGEDLIGPPLGATLFSLGQAVPLLGNALSFAASSALIVSLKGTFIAAGADPGADKGRSTLRAEVAEGLRWLLRNRVLRALAFTAALSNMVFAAKSVLLILLAKNEFGLGNLGFGILMTLIAVGALSGSLLAPMVAKRVGPGTMRCAGMIIEGLSIAALGLSPNPWFAGVMLAVTGCSMCVQNIVTGSLRQRIIPTRLLGRVLSASRLVALSGAPIGAVLGGYLASVLEVRAPFVLGGAFMIVVALAALPALSDRSIAQVTAEAEASEPPDRTPSES